jgi:hypothetical protein
MNIATRRGLGARGLVYSFILVSLLFFQSKRITRRVTPRLPVFQRALKRYLFLLINHRLIFLPSQLLASCRQAAGKIDEQKKTGHA